MDPVEAYLHRSRIAYFSMEMALCDDIPTYSGGLGVLAGDTLRAAADLDLPLVGVTLVSRMGYFRQVLGPNGDQLEDPQPWEPTKRVSPLDAKVAVTIEQRKVWIRAWLFEHEGSSGCVIPVVMLDTDLPENRTDDRSITDFLYGGDEEYRLRQEVVLGIGGARMLLALGFSVNTYHMNEGHSALLALELLRRFERPAEEVHPGESTYDVGKVRNFCLFTTHTPVEAGHDQFPYDLVSRVLGDFVDPETMRLFAGEDRFNMTRLAMNLSGWVNGVAKKHAEVSSEMFPGYRIHAITNGIHGPFWTAPSLTRLYDRYLPDWRFVPEILVRADRIPDAELWAAHQEAKAKLIERVEALTGVQFKLEVPILGFARRMTAYKRPELLFSDPSRLDAIAGRLPFQLIVAGKAHPKDQQGKALIVQIHRHLREMEYLQGIYLPDYGLDLARLLVSGSDVWLNTPLPPMEASGTSGMKAAFNGVLNLSVVDGWWLEGLVEGVTGWGIGTGTVGDEDDAFHLYEKLGGTVLPLYYQDCAGWIGMMKGAIGEIGHLFNSHSMMRRYATEAYIR